MSSTGTDSNFSERSGTPHDLVGFASTPSASWNLTCRHTQHLRTAGIPTGCLFSQSGSSQQVNARSRPFCPAPEPLFWQRSRPSSHALRAAEPPRTRQSFRAQSTQNCYDGTTRHHGYMVEVLRSSCPATFAHRIGPGSPVSTCNRTRIRALTRTHLSQQYPDRTANVASQVEPDLG